MADDIVPIIKLGLARTSPSSSTFEHVASTIADACYKFGFFVIADHGISDQLIDQSRELSQGFFRRSEEQKRRLQLVGRGRGYIPFESERLGATIGDQGPGDLKESFNFCADFDANVWPEEMADFRSTLESLFTEMLKLNNLLLDLCAVSLKLPRDFFYQFVDQPKATLRLSYYPIVSSVKDGQARVSAHTDYGTLTILLPDPEVGGLQILYRGEEWIDVTNPPGTFVVNVGDIMERWTNGRWKSTLHRVIIPAGSTVGNKERLSLVFLHNPNPDALISAVPTCVSDELPVKYPPIIAGEHLKAKSQKSRGEAISVHPP